MQRNDLIAVTQLSNLFPLYGFAVKEISNEHSMINRTRFRDVIIGLANNKNYFPQVNLFVKEVNQKVIKANNLEYLKRFTQYWNQMNGNVKTTKKVSEKKETEKTKVSEKAKVKKVKKVNSDDDVDDKLETSSDISL